MLAAKTLENWNKRSHEHNKQSYQLYVRGEGRGVIVVHELNGITQECLRFANRLVDAGFRVYMPHLFGPLLTLGGTQSVAVKNLLSICISREWNIFRSGRTSPIIDWVRSVCRLAHEECEGPGVGAIGMCLTGNFALTLFATDDVLAPVLSQPSIPSTPLMPWNRRRFDMSDEHLEMAKQRASNLCENATSKEPGSPTEKDPAILAYRFKGDKLCAAAKFERLRNEFGHTIETHELPDAGPTGHSVFTTDFIDKEGTPTREALQRVIRFLKHKLEAREA